MAEVEKEVAMQERRELFEHRKAQQTKLARLETHMATAQMVRLIILCITSLFSVSSQCSRYRFPRALDSLQVYYLPFWFLESWFPRSLTQSNGLNINHLETRFLMLPTSWEQG